MKTLLFIFLSTFSLVPFLVKSQDIKPDIILLTNGTKIEVILNEIGKTDIKYRKLSNPNGPVYVIDKNEVNSILYANGETELIKHAAGTKVIGNDSGNASNTGSITNKPLSEKKSRFIAKYRDAESGKILSEMKRYKRRSVISKVAGTALATGGLATILIGVLNYSSADNKADSEWGANDPGLMWNRAIQNSTWGNITLPSHAELGLQSDFEAIGDGSDPNRMAKIEALKIKYKSRAIPWYADKLREKNQKVAVAGIGVTGIATVVYLLGASSGWKYRLLRQEAQRKDLSLRIEPQWLPGRNFTGVRVALLF